MDACKCGGRERTQMKTDVIQIEPNGAGIALALEETEKAAAFRGLSPKQTLRLRLLAEEMTGMLNTITGQTQYRYWVESEGNAFSLHLMTNTVVDADMREALLKTSTSGKNAAAKGFMGRLKDIFLRLGEVTDANAFATEYGYGYVGVVGYDASVDMSPNAMLYGWSMSAYRSAIEARQTEEPEKWDELEKSITAKLADEVKIFIRGNSVEMVIEKAF
jgi:hypothetical protein